MFHRKIVTAMIEDTYEQYEFWREDGVLDEELNEYNDNIPVWRDMSENTKCAAIEYVHNNRDTIELHSELVQSWVQATVYFMLYKIAFVIAGGEEPELEMFFDDLDFMMDESILKDNDIRKMMGIGQDFTEKF